MIEVDALLFDLDGTLVDSKTDLIRSVRWLQKRYGRAPASEAEGAKWIGDGVEKLVERALPRLRANALRSAIEAFKSHYAAHCVDTTRPCPGALEALIHFRHKKLAVITNKPARIARRMLESLGLGLHFRCVLGGDSLREKKPAAQPLLAALSEMKVATPQRAVMVGDGLNDLRAGEAAGAFVCLVRSNVTSSEALLAARPHFFIRRLDELPLLFL